MRNSSSAINVLYMINVKHCIKTIHKLLLLNLQDYLLDNLKERIVFVKSCLVQGVFGFHIL